MEMFVVCTSFYVVGKARDISWPPHSDEMKEIWKEKRLNGCTE